MFGKIIDFIVKWICSSSEKAKDNSSMVSFERDSRLDVNDSAQDTGIIHNVKDRKKNKSAEAKKYSPIFSAFHYMNTRAEEANFGSSVTHV